MIDYDFRILQGQNQDDAFYSKYFYTESLKALRRLYNQTYQNIQNLQRNFSLQH